MTAKEALELYKSRDASEKLFKADKTFLGGKSERMYTEEGLGGKLLTPGRRGRHLLRSQLHEGGRCHP